MRYLIAWLLMSNFAFAQDGVKHRGELVKVLSATSVQVKEFKKPVVLKLRGVTEAKLNAAQKAKAVSYLKQQLSGQVLIWEEFKDGAEISPNGVGQISKSLLEQGLVKLDPKAPDSYKPHEELAKTRKIGLWAK